MKFSTEFKSRKQPIADFFGATFGVSEGHDEGVLIGDLARSLMADTPEQDLHVVTAWDERALIGGIIFSRLFYDNDDRTVFVLGPVAVATDRQGQGIGQKLIAHGLSLLRRQGIDMAVTYGDPNYYRRVGFAPVTVADVPAPFDLKYPEGWLGQPLTEDEFVPLRGPSRCVSAFNDPTYW